MQVLWQIGNSLESLRSLWVCHERQERDRFQQCWSRASQESTAAPTLNGENDLFENVAELGVTLTRRRRRCIFIKTVKENFLRAISSMLFRLHSAILERKVHRKAMCCAVFWKFFCAMIHRHSTILIWNDFDEKPDSWTVDDLWDLSAGERD